MFGKFQKQQRGREGQPTDELMIQLYAPLVFDEARELVMELASGKVELDSDDLDHIKEVAGNEFAGKVQNLRGRIRETVHKDHLGFFDGWVKRVVNENFGSGTDFAMESGDQSSNFLALVLKGQAKKHSAIALVMDFLGVTSFQETKKFVEPRLNEATAKIKAIEAEVETKKKAEAPKQADYPSFTEYLKAKSEYERLIRTGTERVIELKKAIAWLRNWVSRKEGEEKPVRSKKQMLLDQVAGLTDQIESLREEERARAGEGEYGIAGEKKVERVKLEAERAKLETEVANLDAPPTGEAPKPSGTTEPVVSEPIGRPTIVGDLEAAKQKAGDVNAKIEAVKAEIQWREEYVADQEKSAGTHHMQAEELFAEADKVRSSDRTAALRKDVEANGHEESAATAEASVIRAEAEIAELNTKLKELVKTVAEAPKAEKKAKRVKAATSEPASETTPAGLVVVSSAVVEEQPAQVIEVMAAAVETPPAQVVTVNGTPTLKEFVVLVKASDKLEPEEKTSLRARAAGGDLTGAYEAFQDLTV